MGPMLAPWALQSGMVIAVVLLAPRAEEINLAEGKDTWQISIYGNHASNRAVDGNYNPTLGQNHCSMTNSHKYPWWAVDLVKSYQISHVFVIAPDSSSK